jgi:protein SCO1/2
LSKKALLALCLAIVLPLVSYLIVKELSTGAIHMPPRYYADSVINKVVNGKSTTDTIWHQVSNITLTNQLGKNVSLDDLKGKIIVADFFFTRCPAICPTLTKNMKLLQQSSKVKDIRKRVDSSYVHFLSFSVDPERDSVPVIKRYADKYGVNHDGWWLLTGPKKDIYEFSIKELKLGLEDKDVTEDFVHTNRFVLLDKDRVVRGYYNGLDTTSLSHLAEDIVILLLEKDKKKKRKLF